MMMQAHAMKNRATVQPASSIAPTRARLLQRKCACGGSVGFSGECEGCAKKRLGLRRRAAGPATGIAPPIVHDVLRSPGQPLDANTRAFMEPRFGHDFSRVRVHADARAARSADAVNALAYTVGHNIVLGAGQYAPGTTAGSSLLAHELTHVLQQEAGGSSAVQMKPALEQPGDPFEREANFMADAVTHRRASPLQGRAGESLPYREATELAKCIQIMGEKSVEYCRETVLGEKPLSDCDITAVQNPLSDFSTFQSPGASHWWGAKFGCYRSSCSHKHEGWDIYATSGTPIIAAATGKMTHHQDPGGYGDYIKLKSEADPTRVYLYGHLSAREPASRYCVGKSIGQTGTTGNASANRPHLHFQVHVNGTPVDPAGYFTEPTQVIEESGTSATVIDKTLPAPCAPCAM